MGYHKREIPKGVLGKTSKLREELEELEDAEEQGILLLAMCELADIYGALEALAIQTYGVTMKDLQQMSEATARAFKDGSRK